MSNAELSAVGIDSSIGLEAEAAAGVSGGSRPSTLFVLSAALLARLLVMLTVLRVYPRDWLYTRGIEMGLLAESLLRGQGYSSPFGGSTGPTAFIAPGYPTLIAGIFLVFGSYSFASVIAIMTLQVLVSVGTVWLMLTVARQVFDERAAVLGASFWAVSVPLLWIPTIFWETSLSACALLGMVALALWAKREISVGRWALLGVYCAGIGLINPALLPSLVAMMGWVAFETWRRIRWGLAVGLVTLAVAFSAWPVRNAVRFHAFIPLRSTVGFELWMGNRPGATGYLDESVFPMYNKQELANYVAEGELAYTQGKSEAAWRYIRERPGMFARLSVQRFWRFWTGTGNSTGSPFFALHASVTCALGLAGLALAFRRGLRGFAALVAIPIVLFPLPYYITHAEFRYRLVIDPIMTLLAGYAVTEVLRRLRPGGGVERPAES